VSKRFVITRIVTSSTVVPYGTQYYPGMTPEEAIELEKEQGPEEWGEYFFEESNVDDIKTFVEVVDFDD